MKAARHAVTRSLVSTAWALAVCSSPLGCNGGQVSPAEAGSGGVGATPKIASDLAVKDGAAATTCTGSPSGACTPTEQLFLQHDPSCYACLLKQGCVDDVTFNDKGNECGDLLGSTEGGAARDQACLDVVACTLAHSSAGPVINTSYCGTATGLACARPKSADGPCLAPEQIGAESTDPMVVLSRYTDKTYAAGMANAIFQCAISNHCAACLR